MSTAVGFAASNDRLTYLIIGDLSFFYDMNALWINSLPKTMRIVLVNNHGGSMLYKPFMRELMAKYPMSNLGTDCKQVTAEGWATTCGFDYRAVHTMEQLEACTKLMSDENHEKPILVEAFTDYFEDAYSYLNSKGLERRTLTDKAELAFSKIMKKIKK